jgi:predicted Zn-dependent peptidase
MKYTQITPYIHVLTQPLDRQKVEIETILSSGGSWFEKSNDRGKKHLMEHCIIARTKDMNFQQLKDYAFRENLYLNAYTGPMTMGFEGSSHHTDFYKLTDLLLETTLTPTFDQQDLDREKEIVLREISERSGDPAYKLHFDTMNQVYSKGSIENHQVIGDSKLVSQTTLTDFKLLHEENLQQSHLLISASGGGIDAKYLENKVREFLSQTNNPFIQKLVTDNGRNAIDFYPSSHFQDFHYLPYIHELAHEHAEVSIFMPCEVSFENRPSLQIFQNLFLKYGGVLYDTLRDELGLVYGLYSQFNKDLQILTIQLSCEAQYIQTILQEIDKVFSDFETYFNPTKFDEFKNILKKREDIAQDTLGATVNHTVNTLRTYGVAETYEEYSKRMDAISPEEIKGIYNNIQNGLTKKRVLAVSKNKEIKTINLP